MARKRRLDQYLNKRRQNPEASLEAGTRRSNLVFRLCVGAILTLTFVLVATSPYNAISSVTDTTGMGICIFVAAAIGALCLSRVQPGVFDRPSAFNQFVVLILLFLGICRFMHYTGISVYFLPLPLFAMIFAMMFSQGAAMVISAGLAFYAGFFGEWAESSANGLPVDRLGLTCVLTFGAFAAVLGVRRIRKQSRPVTAGFYVGVVQALILLGFFTQRGMIQLDANFFRQRVGSGRPDGAVAKFLGRSSFRRSPDLPLAGSRTCSRDLDRPASPRFGGSVE